ncbi:CBN-NAS-28 protein, partial [Aphelenchoides avenae]
VRANFLEQHANQPEYRYLKRIATEEKGKQAVQRKNVAVQNTPEVLKPSATVEAGSIPKQNEPLLSFLYQGDILLTEKDAIRLNFTKSMKQNRAGGFSSDANGRRIGPVIKWPHTTPICYRFNQGADAYTMEVARQAFRFLTENSCLAWQENCATQPVVTVNTSSAGCRLWGAQRDRSSCFHCRRADFATATHEASHVMGMWHEQARPDRDSYIDIQWNNVAPWKAQYNKADIAETFGIPYDYGSNMHYGGRAFSATIDMEAKEKMYQHTMGNKYGPIFNDLKFINVYNDCMCKSGIACQNGGFPHPRQCTSKCICPKGFDGATCAERPAGCGAIVQATATVQSLRVNVPAPNAGSNTIPHSVTSNDCRSDCMYGSTEIKFGDLTRGGARVCCAEHAKEFGAVSTTQDMAIVRVCSMRGAQEAVIDFKTM